MRAGNPLGFGHPLSVRPYADSRTEHLIVQSRLNRILSFTGRTIHDVINDPISRNIVKGYYKLSRQIDCSSEVTELERQWNGLRS